MQDIISPYKELIDNYISRLEIPNEPKNLYVPVRYALDSGGKRLRSVLSLIAADVFVNDLDIVVPAASMLEIFHNFSLVHDDIMDAAPLRRGEESVFKKYGTNTGILSGDVMLIYCYKLIHDNYDAETAYKILGCFTKMSIELCEGQQMDMDFEESNNVEIGDYIQMITYKTAVLIAAALKIGAIAAKASEMAQHHLYHFGMNIGIAFQIQDDILDVYGDPKVGKVRAGDIINNKKTYLYLKSLELANDSQRKLLERLFAEKTLANTKEDKIEQVLQIYNDTHVRIHAQELMNTYRDLAFSHLEAINIEEKYKSSLKTLGNYILERKY